MSESVVALCPSCGAAVPCDFPQVVLACWSVLTAYRRADQSTRVERYAHGLGRSRQGPEVPKTLAEDLLLADVR